MVVKHEVSGYDEFIKFIDKFEVNAPTFILYTGTKLPNGKSWCPDCVEAKPAIDSSIKSAPEHYNFVVVEVGDRPTWKDPNCPFRTNTRTRVTVIPTIVKWGTQKRLEGDECKKKELVKKFLSEAD